MRRFKTKYFLFFIIVFSVIAGNAQDIHFSQFYSTPLYLNPALTGLFPCNFRFGLNYRSQWSSVVPFTTQAAWGDGKINKHLSKRKPNDWFGVGGMIYSDNAAKGLMTNTKFMVNAAYHKGLLKNNMFNTSIGISLGMVNRSANLNSLIFDNQWNGSTFSSSANGESFASNSFYYFDMNAGILLTFKKSKYEAFLGASLNHLTKPNTSFTTKKQNMTIRSVIHGGATLQRKKIAIKPQFMVATQGISKEIILGANFIYNLNGVDLYIGIFDRLSGDAIPTLGFDLNGWLFLFTYDVNYAPYISSLTGLKGGWEFSLTKTFGCASKSSGIGGGPSLGKSGKKRDNACPAYN